jgi:hypothetical protein
MPPWAATPDAGRELRAAAIGSEFERLLPLAMLYGLPSTTAHHRGAAAAGVQIRAAAAERVAANAKKSGPLFRNYPLSGRWVNDANDPNRS